MIQSNIVRELLFAGVKFKYISYDHKEAIKEMVSLGQIPQSQFLGKFSYEIIPNNIKQNHLIWRIGKLRHINFRPDGEIRSVRIGNKYYKTFFLSDFGVDVKPIIFPSNDKYNLIGQHLAVPAQ